MFKFLLLLGVLVIWTQSLNAENHKLKCYGFPVMGSITGFLGFVCNFYHYNIKENDEITVDRPMKKQVDGNDHSKLIAWLDGSSVLTHASIRESTFYTVPPQIFETLTNIKNLEANGQKIQVIAEDSFKYAAQLQYLSLRDNQITKLDKMIFSEAKNLIDIVITGNKIESIDEEAFRNLQNLKKLILSHNEISVLTTEHFKDMTSLETIELDYNSLESLPGDLFTNNLKLKHVQFSNNKLKSVGSAFKSLNQLESLQISQNQLEELELPNSNKILSHLSVGNNKLSKIELEDFAKIKFLNISGNAFGTDLINSFLKKEDLETLDISYNHLGKIQIDAFSSLKRIKVLKLKSTDLSGITYGTFSKQEELEELDISYNNFNKFNFQKLHELKKLKSLNIEGNALKKVSGLNEILTLLPKLEKIRLSDNEWDCEFLLDMVTKLKASRRITLEVPHPITNLPNTDGIVCIEKESDEN